jgi:hypothetical protein
MLRSPLIPVCFTRKNRLRKPTNCRRGEEFCTHTAFVGARSAFCIDVALAALARYVHNLQCCVGCPSGESPPRCRSEEGRK